MDRLPIVARTGLALLLLACAPKQELVVERVQAIAATQASSLAAREPPASASAGAAAAPVHHEQTEKRKLCDRTYAAKEGPKITAPGHATWVNLWAAWCKPCVAEIPELKAWAEAGGFHLLFVSLDDDQREWKAGVEKLGLPHGEDGQVRSRWLGPGKARAAFLRPLGFLDTPSLPGQALADKHGHLRCFRSGAIESDEKDAFLALIAGL